MRLSFTALWSILLLCTNVNAKMSLAPQRVYQHQIDEDIISLNPSKKDLSAKEKKQLIDLLVSAKEIFSLKTITSRTPAPDQLTKEDVLQQTKILLISPSKWEQRPSKVVVEKIKAKKAFLQSAFGEKSIQWAWILNQLEEKQKSKELLKDIFESQYKEVMGMTTLNVGHGTDPLSELQSTSEILKVLNVNQENAEIQDKLKKAKIHIGQLPQLHILT